MQTIIRTGTAQEQIDAAKHNLDRLGGDLRSENMKGRLQFYFQARIETANAMNLQRIADSLEQLVKLPKNQPVKVSEGPATCTCGAEQPGFGSEHAQNCPKWAPF